MSHPENTAAYPEQAEQIPSSEAQQGVGLLARKLHLSFAGLPRLLNRQ